MKKVAIHNLGCKVNSYEAESMELMLKNAGYEIVPFDEAIIADVYIINTCSVTNIADRKSRQMLHKAKKMNPSAVVIAAGCYVQADEAGVKKDEAVDIVLGNNMKINIVDVLEQYFKDNTADEYVVDISHDTEYEELKIDKVSEHTRAYIKIQDGCNQFCSYCIIPYARGRIRSRKMDSIKDELERLANNGFKEVVFTGINLSCYDDNGKKLIDVIELAENTEGIERIRLGSLDPEVVTEEFAHRLSKVTKICPHFHLSMQSGCDTTLKAMNRRYTSEEYYNKCMLLREKFINPAFTTDVIVGFPQESDEDYATTREFVKKVGFSELHVFKYSRRDGTVAAKMIGQVDETIKSKRSEDLISVGESLKENYRKEKIGEKVSVLFEEEKEINGIKYQVGHTKEYIEVAVETKENLAGKIEEVFLKDFIDNEIMLATRKVLY